MRIGTWSGRRITTLWFAAAIYVVAFLAVARALKPKDQLDPKDFAWLDSLPKTEPHLTAAQKATKDSLLRTLDSLAHDPQLQAGFAKAVAGTESQGWGKLIWAIIAVYVILLGPPATVLGITIWWAVSRKRFKPVAAV